MQCSKSLTLCRAYFTVQDNYRKFPIDHSTHAIKPIWSFSCNELNPICL